MKPIPIPRLSSFSTAIADVTKRRDDMGAQIVAAEKERHETILAIHRRGILESPPPTEPAALRVSRLLGEAPPPIVPESRAQLAEMAQRIFDLKAAWAILDARLKVEQSKANAHALAVVAPEYRKRIRAVCEALRGVHAANVELHAFTNALDNEGIAWASLGIVAPNAVGNPGNPYSPAGQYLKDAADQGFIERNEIPESIRQ
ncbi:hypothetical protein [Rhizobium sp. Root482]|uniref:hypothetical protein n=1 Tax=Rhizobium sp. Root482 TaxID=1736543 RepID=UPI0006FBC876|nr:hypothetical protein [Rhizobium sp. Root482]KQY12616.1 hypothetical protein ASD31_15410 [Rhizobium sp. Root482]